MQQKIDILFETEDLLVINKPAGLMVHPAKPVDAGRPAHQDDVLRDGKQEKETLVDWILETYPEIAGVGEPMLVDGKTIDRPGIVHRLDEETSGVMLIAKKQETFELLKAQFQNHRVQKEYHAFVWGVFKEGEGVVDVSIGRNKNDFRRWHAGRGTRGELRDAQTRWRVAGTVSENEESFSLMHLFPKTGRTHQLRVHMKYLQHPIVSDSLYTPTKPKVLGFDRVALHARTITFSLPAGEQKVVTAPYPGDFETALARTNLL